MQFLVRLLLQLLPRPLHAVGTRRRGIESVEWMDGN